MLLRLFGNFYLSTVSLLISFTGTRAECPIKLNPPSVVVEYGSNVLVNCSTDVKHDGIGWEASVGSVPMTTDKLITWRVSNLRRWGIKPQCYMNYDRKQCETFLPITIYKTPDIVSINPVNTGPMIERFQYELQCDIVNVAPVKSLIVKWFKAKIEVHSETFNDTIKTPVNIRSKLQITADRDDDGVQYRCEAELNLGADGPQPPPKVTSEPLNIPVHFKPAINETKMPSTVSVIRGYPVRLVCEAEGNPPPEISWSQGNSSILGTSNGILTLDEVSDEAVYTCTAVNSVDKTTRIVKVVITENYLPIIVGVTVAVMVVILFIFIYLIYYRKNKMAQYIRRNFSNNPQSKLDMQFHVHEGKLHNIDSLLNHTEKEITEH